MSGVTSHVLDTSLGRPVRGLAVRLDVLERGGGWRNAGGGLTDDDGRVRLSAGPLANATYRVTFETGAHLAASGRPAFYPVVEVVFSVDRPHEHHHIPLLLSPFGYSTYRGS